MQRSEETVGKEVEPECCVQGGCDISVCFHVRAIAMLVKLNVGWPSTRSDTGKSRPGTKRPRVRSLRGTSVNSKMHESICQSFRLELV